MPKRKMSSSDSRGKKRGRYSSKRKSRRYSAVPRNPRGMKRTMLKMARSVMLRSCETKYTAFSSENAQLYHNNGFAPVTFSPVFLQNICATAIGTAQNQRVGDEVYAQGISLKFWISNKLDRPNVSYRVFVIACPPDQVTTSGPANLMKGNIGNRILDYIDTDRYNVVYQRILNPMSGDYSLENGATNREHSQTLKVWIPLKGKLVYQLDGSTIPKYQKYCLSVGMVAYDAFGSLQTDNIASVACVGRFYFKDP